MNVVLFKEDVERIPCIFDLKTKNTSFLRMAALLKSMGIKNHLFMLTLLQPKLQGVDPFSANLTEEQIIMITTECKLNPWYFFREICRVPSSGGDAIRFELNRANLATIWCFLNDLNVFLTMPRQIGKTITTSAIVELLLYILGKNMTLSLFAKGASLQAENISRIKSLRDGLPSYLWKSERKYNNNNQESLVYYPHNTKYQTFVAASSKVQANAQGRGETSVFQHWDEFGSYDNNFISYDVAKSASDAGIDNARKAGLPAGIIITTTAGYTNTKHGAYAYETKERALRFTERLYDLKDKAELTDVVMKGSDDTRMVYLEYSHLQLGKDDAWFREKTAGKSKDKIDTDYRNIWLHGSGDNIISRILMDKLLEHVLEPISTTIDQGLVFHWWAEQTTLNLPEFKNIPFIIGSDTSDMIGEHGDFTTLVMVNPKDMSVVMTMRCNSTNMVYVAEALISILKRFPRAIFVPENNRASVWIDVLIDRMKQERMDPFTRIFNQFVENFGDRIDSSKRDLTLGSVRKQFGFHTDKTTRNSMLYGRVLATTVERNFSRIFSKVIVDELSGLTLKNGRIDHQAGQHDDTLIAYLLACWFIMFARNINSYGIQPGEIIQTDEEGEFKESKPMQELRKRIAYLEEKLESKTLSAIVEKAFAYELKDLKAILELKTSTDENKMVNNVTRISVHQTNPVYTPPKLANVSVVQNDLNLLAASLKW